MEASKNTKRCALWRASNAEHMKEYRLNYSRENYQKLYARRKESLAKNRLFKRISTIFLSILV